MFSPQVSAGRINVFLSKVIDGTNIKFKKLTIKSCEFIR